MKKIFIIIIIIVVVLVLGAVGFFLFSEEGDIIGDILPSSAPEEVVSAPDVDGMIKGFWSSRGGMIESELDDAGKMREIGINAVTFSPSITHDEEGNIVERTGVENEVKQNINKAHQEGFQVFLDINPMNAGAVDPRVTNPTLFAEEVTRVALKYATIAEEYQVEYFAPIVEPLHHISADEANTLHQDLLPKLREVYSGDIMWKKQSMHIDNAREWDVDHVLEMGFIPSTKNIQINFKETMNSKVSLSLSNDRMSLERYSDGNSNIKESKNISITSGQQNKLQIEIRDKKIIVSLNDNEIFDVQDTSGPEGGYSISSEELTINKFELKDTSGNVLLGETFTHLNNWNPKEGWTIENNQLIISSGESAKLIYDIDFSGYDFIAIDTFRRGQAQTSEEYLEHLAFVMDKTNDQAVADGVPKVLLAEFGGSIEEDVSWIDVDARAKIPITATELADVTYKVLIMAEEKGIDGYMYNGWDTEGQGINQLPEIEAVIRDWYTSH